jgi:CheY-like chemotaxis protein
LPKTPASIPALRNPNLEKKIIIVEDSDDSRDLLALMLKIQGYSISTASDGQEALRLIKLDCPDLIITDINMPNMNGIELIRQVRQLSECSHLPIVVMTAYGSGKLSDAISAGADQGVKKPVDFDSFIDGINRLFTE